MRQWKSLSPPSHAEPGREDEKRPSRGLAEAFARFTPDMELQLLVLHKLLAGAVTPVRLLT